MTQTSNIRSCSATGNKRHHLLRQGAVPKGLAGLPPTEAAPPGDTRVLQLGIPSVHLR